MTWLVLFENVRIFDGKSDTLSASMNVLVRPLAKGFYRRGRLSCDAVNAVADASASSVRIIAER
jgi:hypothetical protein